MVILLSPLVDSISGLVASNDTALDFSNPASYQSIHPTLDAIHNFLGVAQVISGTLDPELYPPFTSSCKMIAAKLIEVRDIESRLVANPSQETIYRSEYLPCLQAIAEHMGLLLKAQGSSIQDRVDRACLWAIECTRSLLKATASGGDGAKLIEQAEAYKTSCVNVTKTSQRALENTDNIERKNAITAAEKALLEKSPQVIVSVQRAANNPTQENNKSMLTIAQEAINTIKEIQNAVSKSFVPPPPPQEEINKVYLTGMGLEAAAKWSDDFLKKLRAGVLTTEDIMVASAEAVRVALELAKMAEAHAMTLDDLKQRAKIIEAKSEVERCAQELLEAQRYLALHPNDPEALLRVQRAYARLQEAIARMVATTVGEANMSQGELGEAMRALQRAAGGGGSGSAVGGNLASVGTAVTVSGTNIIAGLATKFKGKSGKDRVKIATEIQKDTESYLKQLEELINSTNDPIYKAKLQKIAKVIKDRSLQLKIISTVKANDNSPEGEEAVQNVARLLSESIAEANQMAHAVSLRQRFTKAVDTVVAVQKVAAAFKKSLAANKKK